jgi:diaminohydroxyphosphoribosylaminopyrimidine deaminase/5-amino-6-(5-phosphoribosylamino)uracil reductase
MVDDKFYMELCLKEAWKYQGLTYPNPAVGSLILDKYDKLIAIDAHYEAGHPHAELNVISKALEILGDKEISNINNPANKHQYILDNHNNQFKDFTIYVTLEPCNHTGSTPPCTMLIETLGFKKIVIGTMDPNTEASGGAKLLESSGLKVIKGILQNECNQLLEPFKKWQKNEPYIFFKLATTKNGVYTGGTISSLNSRIHVHKLRDKIDLLIIGGNTVRVDRPTLDCRLCGGRPPDILIYSTRDDFDTQIPLFKVKGRKVFIEKRLDMIKKYHFIMIEGADALMKETIDIVDHYMIFTAPNFKIGKTIQLDMKLKNLNKYQNELDTIEWFKKI